MHWITRERPKIDRLACPWLILRFIDPTAIIHFVPESQVLQQAQALGAIPFDLPGVDYTHYEDRCTFDYFLQKHKLTDPALHVLAPIIRGLIRTIMGWLPNQRAYGLFRLDWPTTFRTMGNYWLRA
nr:chromate resistance protein ChrB domain-containing protein [Spirosoma luteum]